MELYRLFGWMDESIRVGSNPFLRCLDGGWEGWSDSVHGIFHVDACSPHPSKTGGRSEPSFLRRERRVLRLLHAGRQRTLASARRPPARWPTSAPASSRRAWLREGAATARAEEGAWIRRRWGCPAAAGSQREDAGHRGSGGGRLRAHGSGGGRRIWRGRLRRGPRRPAAGGRAQAGESGEGRAGRWWGAGRRLAAGRV